MHTPRQRTWRAAMTPVVSSAVMVFLFVWLFAAALHQPQAHDLPVGLVAPSSVAQKVRSALENNAPGAFVLSTFSSTDEARTAIRERDIDGALVFASEQTLIMVASAAGEASSKAISGALGTVAEALGQSPTVEDVQPLPATDSRGMVPFFLVLGVTVSAFMFQQLSRSQARTFPLGSAAISMVVFAALDGLLAALAVGAVVGFDSSYWSLAGVCALLALAVAAATAVFLRLFGRAGVGLAGLIVILLANASSGSVIGSHFLPQPFRWLSPVLPAGSGLEAARSALYFDGEGLGWPLGVLALWVLGSLVVLVCLELRRTRARRRADAPA